MWIVRLALNRTYTFVVAALLIGVLGAVSIYRLSTGVLSNIDIPVVSVMIPAAAPATRTTGPRVAVLDDQHRVRYRDVELGRDYGAEVQVLAGLKQGEQVVVHPGDDLPEGTAMEPVPLSK
jgi:multidrug efflux pump subunit AcrA (membrane-fusion protein)